MIAHVEAGLRSFDSRTMPEEVNRVLTDHMADVLFVTEQSGVRNLIAEGIDPARVHLVGNTMIDSLLACRERADASDILEKLRLDVWQSRCTGRSRIRPCDTASTGERRSSRVPAEHTLRAFAILMDECRVIFPGASEDAAAY